MDASGPEPAPKKRRSWAAVLGVVVVSLLALLLVGLVTLQRHPVPMPAAWVPELETRLIETLKTAGVDEAEVGLDAVALRVSPDWRPSVDITGAHIRVGAEGPQLDIPLLSVTFSRRALRTGALRPTDVVLAGTRLAIDRDAEGRVGLALPSGAVVGEGQGLTGLLAGIDGFLDRPALEKLRSLRLEDIGLTVTDTRLGEELSLRQGEITILTRPEQVRLDFSADLVTLAGTSPLSGVFETPLEGAESRFSARVADVPLPWMARVVPPAAGLELEGAPLSLALEGATDRAGRVARVSADLEVGAGSLTLPGTGERLSIDGLTAEGSHTPGSGRVSLDRVTLATGRGALEGTAWLSIEDAMLGNGWPFRIDLDHLTVDAAPMIDLPQSLSRLTVEGRLTADRQRLEIGQAVAVDALSGAIVHASASLTAEGALRVDAESAAVPAARVTAFWPLLKKGRKARQWIKNNILGGTVYDATFSVRRAPREKPLFGASFRFEDGTARILRRLPQVQGASGFGTLMHHGFTITVTEGRMETPAGPPVSLAGSVFRVPDMRIKGGTSDLWLRAEGPLPSALDVLARPPLRLKEKQPILTRDLTGRLALDGLVQIVISDKPRVPQDTLRIDGQLTDFAFNELAPGKTLRAEDLTLSLAQGAFRLAGDAMLNDLPLKVDLITRPDLPGAEVTGVAQVSDPALQSLGIGLPDGLWQGTAGVDYRLSMGADAPPTLEARSQLVGAAMQIPAIGWSKPEATQGALALDITLGPTPALPLVAIDAAGLIAEGRLDLQPDGGMRRLQLDRVRLGTWLDASAVLTGRGAGQSPAIELTGGALDVRGLGGSGGGGGSGAATPISLRMDEVRVAPDLALRSVAGVLSADSVLTGSLTGQVNGGAGAVVDLAGLEGRQGVRVTSPDAGGVLRSAGITESVRGGALDLVLELEERNVLDGTLQIQDSRLVETPAVVDLLSAVSIVGLIDQMAHGDGLALTTIETGISISAGGVRLRDGLANGPALGVTFDGTVAPSVGQMDLQGVISPFFALNSVGQLFSARPGEGLFGVNYRVFGDRRSPTVEVNPLSILTPGAFRELFRRPPPELSQ